MNMQSSYNAQGKYLSVGSKTVQVEGVDTPAQLLGAGVHGIYDGAVDLKTQYHDIVSGLPVTISERPTIFSVFDYSTKQWIDPRTLQDCRAMRWALIRGARENEERSGFTWSGSTFDSDPASQGRIQGAVQLALLGLTSIVWTLADNTTRTLQAADILAMGVALGTHVGLCHEKARILRAQIEQALDFLAIEAIVW